MDRPISIKEIPGAMGTMEVIERSTPSILSYVHKWTGEVRKYQVADISLPSTLYYSGLKLSSFRNSVGIGGTRAPTVRVFREVYTAAKALSENDLLIVSGGVPGVDLAAHLGAIDSGSSENIKTISVLANPAERKLCGHIWQSNVVSKIISQNGVFLSEYTSHVDPESVEFKERLLQRDRIISGISDCFIAFECSENSATVDTAKRAVNQGKTVFSYLTNHSIDRKGTTQLVDEGIATPVTSVEEILVAMQRQ